MSTALTIVFVLQTGIIVSSLALWVRSRSGQGSIKRERLPPDASAFQCGTSVDFLRWTFEHLPLAFIAWDERGVLAITNAHMERIFGYRSEEMVGQPITLLIPDFRFDQNDTVLCPSAGQAAARFVSTSNLLARRKDGVEFRVEIAMDERPLGENGTIAFVIDRTDREELRRHREDLAHLTRVSTMGQLAASLAHELNQPLTAILSNVQAAQRFMTANPIDLAEVREILDDIVQDNYRASEVIRRIRAVVKKGDLEVAPLDIASVVHDVVLLVHSDAIVRGMRVVLDIESYIPVVAGDRVQLQQVLLNLLLNAFDAMVNVTPGERVVSVSVKIAGKKVVSIAISDRGHGLTADKLDKIFKPFFTSKPLGLGLGLSISQSIIDMHHGRLWAENNPEGGATFHVLLPCL